MQLVSICTLAYNHGKYIRQCLESLVTQVTDFPYEVIVHDDASTDDTASIIREYELKYPDIVKPIYQKENQYSKGISIGATHIYPRAEGKYIAECEGDDWWTDPYKLQKQVDFLESHPDYSMCCTSYGSFRMSDGFVKPGSGVGMDIGMRNLMKKNSIGTLTVMYRREFLFEYLENVLPSMPKFRMGDIPLWLFMASRGKIHKLADITAMYRILPHSVSHSDDFFRQYDFMLEGSRVRLWINRFLGLRYAFYIRFRICVGTRNFCKRWAKNHGENRWTVMRRAFRYLKSKQF